MKKHNHKNFTQRLGRIFFAGLLVGIIAFVVEPSFSRADLTPTVEYQPSTLTSGDVTATLITDGLSGTISNNSGSDTIIFTGNGNFDFERTDLSGNTTMISASVDRIDRDPPTAAVIYAPNSSTTGPVTATITNFSENTTVLNNSGNSSHIFTENGQFSFEIADDAGNTRLVEALVNRIEETPQNTTGSTGTGNSSTGSPTTGSTNTGNTATTGSNSTGNQNTGTNVTGSTTGTNLTGSTNTGSTSTGNSTTGTQNTGTNLTGSATTTTGNSTQNSTGSTNSGQNSTGTTTQNSQTSGQFSARHHPDCTAEDLTILSPANDSAHRDEITFSREKSDDCDGVFFEIQLRDHNEQRISLGTGFTGLVFASTGLQSSGMYHLDQTGLDSSGNLITTRVHTGQFSGLASDFRTGYERRILSLSGQTLASTGSFSIDNTTPEITNFSHEIHNAISGLVGKNGIFKFSGTTSESLQKIEVFINDEKLTTEFTQDSGQFSGETSLIYATTTGPITREIIFSDAAGNSTTRSGTSDIELDFSLPTVQNFSVTQNGKNFEISRNSERPAKFSFELRFIDDRLIRATGDEFSTGFSVTTPDLELDKIYDFEIVLTNQLGNGKTTDGEIMIDPTRGIQRKGESARQKLATIDPIVEQTILSQVLKKEIQNFESCKNTIFYNNLQMPVGDEKIKLEIPSMNSQKAKLLTANLTEILSEWLNAAELDPAQIREFQIRRKNFFTVLKILQDSDASCTHNLSSYHINQFEDFLQKHLRAIPNIRF